jgi:hypothetical protein
MRISVVAHAEILIAITSDHDGRTRSRNMGLNANSYLDKPFTEADLVGSINELIEP